MATTSPRHHHDHQEIGPIDVDPYLLVNRDHELHSSQTPNDVDPYLLVNRDHELHSSQTPNDFPGFNRHVDVKYYLPLCQAALNDDWESAREFFQSNPAARTARISMQSMTTLHVAASAGSYQFIEKFVQLVPAEVPAEVLAMRDYLGMTALHYATMCRNPKAAQTLVRKNPALTQIMDSEGFTPILRCAWEQGSKEILWYLTSVTTDEPPGKPFTGCKACLLICSVIDAGFHDVALYLIQRYPNLATVTDDKCSALFRLASNPSTFLSGCSLGFWGRRVYPFIPVETKDPLENLGDLAGLPTLLRCRIYATQALQYMVDVWKVITQMAPGIKHVRDEKLKHEQATKLVEHLCRQLLEKGSSQILEFFNSQHVLPVATQVGTVEVVTRCLQFFPDLIGLMKGHYTIFHIAVIFRQGKSFSLLREKIPRNIFHASRTVESAENSILHLAAELPPSPQLKCVSGPALQLQRELQWFKEVEDFAPRFKQWVNGDSKTPWELFMEEHKELLEKGEKWMKDTSSSCMVVATLIATVVFAAAFTVPGGNDNNKGNPIFLKRNSFMVFAISDALALFSASTSLLSFLSILTARYAEEDFLKSLPQRLIIGLASLFFAIATMMIAFCATLSIVLSERLKWISIPVALIACFPVTLFAMLQLPLFIQMVQSTYGSGIFRRQDNLKLW